jgi:hypothetical protein
MRRRLAAVAVLTTAIVAGCDGGVFATGRVVDVRHQPISGARVVLSRGEHSREFKTTTDENGCFGLGGTVAPGRYKYTLLINADGYKFALRDVPTLETARVEVILARQSAAGESQIVVARASTCRD